MNIHDSGYKRLFSNRTIFRQLMESFVAEPWVKEVDFETAETVEKSFVSEHYKETESDLIYKVQLRGRELYIFILLEFQSTVERFMALRILNYVTSFYLDYRDTHQSVELLPPIFPIVLYNGDRTWTAPRNIRNLIEEMPDLGAYALDYQYFKIAENEFSLVQLQHIRNIVSTLFLAEAHYDFALLLDELLDVFDREEDKQAMSLFINWFRQLAAHGRVEQGDFATLEQVYHTKEEVTTMLITALEKERQAIRQEGIEQGIEQGIERGIEQGIEQGIERGIEQGIEQGKAAATRENIENILRWRFGGVPTEISQRLLRHDLTVLGTLVNVALDVQAPDQFLQHLIEREQQS